MKEECGKMAEVMLKNHCSLEFQAFVQVLESELDNQRIKLIIVDAPFLEKQVGKSVVLNLNFFELNPMCDNQTVFICC